MTALKAVFWTSAGLIAWTHVGYPVTAALLARARPRPIRKEPITPPVTVIVAAHDEQAVIERRLENLLALDYPRGALEIVVASDESGDRTDALVEAIAARDGRVRLLRCPREGKTAAQDRAAAEATTEILAFSDANSLWAPDALAKLVRNFADADVGYVTGRLNLLAGEGTNREGVYWRYELWLRASESQLGSITGGNGSIYAVRRSDYVPAEDPRIGHDLGLPYLMAQRGRRAVYEGEAFASEKPARDLQDEFARKIRMNTQAWHHLLSGRMLRRTTPLYAFQLFSHRILRYGSGLLHVTLLVSSAALVGRGPLYRRALAGQAALLALAAAGRLRLPLPGARLALYYVLVTSATAIALVRYFRAGVPVRWDKAEGTR